MIKYAITGNIASGKSEVEKILTKMGYKVLDTDKVAHDLLKQKSDLIIKEFGDYDIYENNGISRKKLGSIVFSDKKMKEKLEKIIHPLVKINIEKFFNENNSEEKIFVSIPLLFETNMQNLFDKIIFIYTDDSIRLKRLMLRNNYNKDYAQTRMNAQISQDKKLEASDIVIYNNSSIKELEDNIKALIL